MYMTAVAAVLRESENVNTWLSHETTRRRDTKMSSPMAVGGYSTEASILNAMKLLRLLAQRAGRELVGA